MNFKTYFYQFIKEDADYRIAHTAPDKDSGSPLYDVTKNGSYPEDFYTSPPNWYASEPYDFECVSIVRSLRNRPNASIKIYRAVPNFNKELDEKIKDINYTLYYRTIHPFFPMSNKLSPYMREQMEAAKNYGGQDDNKIKEFLEKLSADLTAKKAKTVGINAGDWVSISKEYVKRHGSDELKNNFKIITKTVKARNIYTNGDAVAEWGYDP